MVAIQGEATLLLDGVDIEDLTECVEGPVVWPYQGWTQRGEFPQFPAIDGATFIRQPYDTAVLPLQVTLRSPACSGGDVVLSTGTALRDAVRQLRAACRPDRQLTLTRLWADGTSETAAGKFLNITPARPVRNIIQTLVEFTLLELWYGAEESIASAAGSHEILGDTRTHRMEITLAVGAARTITNTVTGHWLTFSTTVPTGGILIDVEARTATAVTGGADYSAFLSWGKDFPMALDPAAGDNTLTVSAGSASIVYQPAYL